jgi:hypothetical protein
MPSFRTPWRRAAAVLAAAGTLTTGAAALSPAGAAATGISAPGSIVYILGDNVHLTTPNGAAQVQVTTDGTPQNPYLVPSESDGGLVVAVKNQNVTDANGSYTQGFVFEFTRSGKLVRTFRPSQFGYIGNGPCANPIQQLPLGFYNAVVSPNGKYIAYTVQDAVQSAGCSTYSGYSSWIANIDGSGATMIADTSNNTASLEIGQFTADSSKLLVDRASFGSVETYVVNVPGSTAQPWTGPASGDLIDQTYQQADVRNGLMVSDGYSKYSNSLAIRLWGFSDFAHEPSAKCEWTSPVSSNIDEYVGRPSLAPDGSAVVFVDANGAADAANEGLYLAAANCNVDQSLFIAHATDPFWTSAAIYDPPSVSITAKPAAYANSRTASVQFTATDPDPSRHAFSFTCRLDGGAAQGCSSPVTLTGLADGAHTLTVTADDGAQSGSASVSWQVDTTPPAASLTAPTTVAQAASSAHLAWTGSDTGSGVAKYQVRYQRAAYSGGFGAWSTPTAWQNLTVRSLTSSALVAGYDYCWSVRAIDRAGNTGAWSRPKCTAIALDDRSLARSSGWTLRTGSVYYANTATTTTRKGAYLTRTHAAVDRIGLVATTCSSCGQVAVYVGSTRVGLVSLYSSSTHYRVLKLLPVFGLRSGTVSVKVSSSGKLLAVDGLVLSRT